MKKLTAILLAILLGLTLFACTDNDKPDDGGESSSESSSKAPIYVTGSMNGVELPRDTF